MADPILEIDAAGSNIDGTNPGSALVITTGNYGLLALDSPAPPVKVQWAASVDTEGSLPVAAGHENRTVTITVDCAGATALNNLTGKLGKLHREGGTLKHTGKSGTTVIADIPATGDYSPAYDHQRLLGDITTVQFTLPARPYLRGTEIDLGDNVETTSPLLIFTDTGVLGDWYGPGRLVIDNDDATNDQRWVIWAAQSRYYSAATTAALFYEAEGRTVLGGAATAAGPSGASGAGSNVVRHTSLPSASYLAILSTQATAAGAHLTHVGNYRVFARVQTPTTNTGTVQVGFEWGTGDFQPSTVNSDHIQTVGTDWNGSWRQLDLGYINIPTTATRWEGRVIAKAAVTGEDIDIDYIWFVPIDESSGETRAIITAGTPTTFAARDEFDQTAGALAAKTLPIGGTWAGAGDTDDFSVDATNHILQRSAGLDTSPGRLAIAGSTNYSAIAVQVDVRANQTGVFQGVLARYTATTDWVEADAFFSSSTTANLRVRQNAGGVTTSLGTTGTGVPVAASSSAWYTIRLLVTTTGDWFMWFYKQGAATTGDPVLRGGGITVAAGKPGLFDNAPQTASARDYDNFMAWVPTVDASIYPSQSLEISHDKARREDSTGTFWQKTSVKGDYLLIPPAGAEARTLRMLVKAVRNDPSVMADNGIDDISARLFYTPRYLTMPD